MVSFQTSGDSPVGAPASQPPTDHPPPRSASTQPPADDASNPWAGTVSSQHGQHHTNGDAPNDSAIPDALQPGLGSARRPPIPQIQHHDTGATTSSVAANTVQSGSKQPDEPIERVPSILRPGGGKSPNSNPFRNKQGNGAASAAQAPTEALSQMHLESATNNPWSSALYMQHTGTSVSEDSRAARQTPPPVMPPEFQQDPWSRQDAVELDATSYTHPQKPLSVPTPEEQSVWGSESLNMSKSQLDSQSTLAMKPADQFSQISDEQQHAWDDLGRTPQMKRRETNKTAGEDSDQDDWNMIDSESSSVAGDPGGAAPGGTRKAETEATTASIPGVGALPVPVADTPIATTTKTPDTAPGPGSSTPFVDAPATPWDKPSSENEQYKNDAFQTAGVERNNQAPERPPFLTSHEPKDEPRADGPLIEPIGYEPPAQPSQAQHPPRTGGLLPEQVEAGPALPPRQAEQAQRWSTTRQPVDGKAETYQIKNIRWNDPAADKNPRVSPILVQNENGPCPLVALVNALSLTTPADTPETTLVQVLRLRERISLNLVLDAVFDELMSPRRTSSEDALPDMSELYEFLQSLHTGMNVNPRFIPTEQMVKAYKRSSLTHLHPTERDGLMPGTFENSLEMKLYATFSIPLIHGWLPARSDPAYDAFERQAASYEDAQNLLFREEELEAKLSDPNGGLSGPEQQLYQDVMTIKMFMSESATQLTPWGIEVISRAMRPGTFAILFRNDHFSTLYCHPSTMQLLTLVTDAGYSSHEEVVWESLEDVNGDMSALFAGDFRPAGSPNPGETSSGPSYANDDAGGGEWSRVQSRRGKERLEEAEVDMGMLSGADHEQEDGDLALALQLQEEEEQKQREEQERRRQESRLSEQFIEQQGRQPPRPVARDSRRRTSGGGPALPSRTSSNVNVTVSSPSGGRRNSDVPPPQPPRPQSQNVRPLVPPPTTTATTTTTTTTGLRPAGRPPVHRPPATESGEEAPPSYEAAQHDRRYVPGQGAGTGEGGGQGQGPGGGHGPLPGGSHTNSSSGGGGFGGGMMSGGGPRPGGGYGPGSAGYRPQRPSAGGRPSQGPGRDRDRDCVVM
ncbi:hypothetical protein V2A60_002626 [Cordyceps javanica]|uniref:DUF544 domain-containing protein n=1 Tax=Cordyceps javanica TaxID=43265 RepID=A0A545UY13_9HYPO|nr:DUF544 domain-containing protein [Cordyceps javanica]TQW06213.1 DUF544 domain protein [Cordyceps javanica]